ncbi:Histone H1-like protein [Hapsidospora chrysogenum ATCC 11550]|uniref:Histone H1 n=1 Tax=Hapsidospora chrysogenum (strain ATCC 11550 / CBS 779.69 / DSM 880 / IAM 14645 / JCM 23072 / IMI 49137) TaxID=857340 RepID=A0A086TG91_HAPC1|nr:Histone H1-like protein [Hapsidospora chrysogenum ATCC 11550]
MAPPAKKATGASKPKASHASYQDMITDAIVNLKDRNGSSRQSLKKYVKANNNLSVTDNMFDSLFNKALKSGVEKGIFEQPKGPSGGTKLAKKKAAAEKKPAAKKDAAKKPAAKKATTASTTKKATTAKKPAEKKATTAATTKKAAPKKAAAPAKAEKPETVLTKTKSGRVAKTQKPAAKKAAPKKAAPKKAAAKA